MVERVRVGDLLHLDRRPVQPDPSIEYVSIGIRSFGKGIFHYEPKPGSQLGRLRFFEVQPGRLIVSNIKGWEGAIAVSSNEDRGCLASNRVLSYTPSDDRIDVNWARWYFLSEPGLEQIRKASPGSADRNRTLAIDRFEALEIPLPSIEEQRESNRRMNRFSFTSKRLLHTSRHTQDMARAALRSWLDHRFATQGPLVELGDIGQVLRGRGPRYESGSGAIAINQACVRWQGIDLTQAREVEQSWWVEVPDVGRVRPGDVLVNSTGEGTIGRAAVATSDEAGIPFDSHVLVVRCEVTGLLPDYLTAYLRSPTGQAQIHAVKGANTTKQTELGKTKLERLRVPVPSIDEQRRLLLGYQRVLARLDEVSTILQRREKAASALLPAALNQAFQEP